jgi:cardiolipin synthase
MWNQTVWIILVEVVYGLLLGFACLRIVFDTRSVSKIVAYLLFAIFVPIVGIVFYFSFGVNYRKRKIYDRKLKVDEGFKKQLQGLFRDHNLEAEINTDATLAKSERLIKMLANKKLNRAFLLPDNDIKLLFNGEEKFPALFEDLRNAKHHIHIEYYIYDDDEVGNQLKDILLLKAREGVKIRFIYDDFGSRGIRKTIVRELRAAGIEAIPFNKINLLFIANRINYRNHRKIVIIDGLVAYTGGVNIADKYINGPQKELYWRDTHIRVKGPAAFAFQQVFISDWNFASGDDLAISGDDYFPIGRMQNNGDAKIQVVASGPDSDMPNILYATLQAINMAQEEVLLTTPYYIPDDYLQECLVMAALGGIKVKLLVPSEGDSKLVNTVSQSYFSELLEAGVEIYRYEKGFVHAKTFVVDGELASVGTANLDLRSFDLNFEVTAMIYDIDTAQKLRTAFYNDLKDAREIHYASWVKRSVWAKITEKILSLISPFM